MNWAYIPLPFVHEIGHSPPYWFCLWNINSPPVQLTKSPPVQVTNSPPQYNLQNPPPSTTYKIQWLCHGCANKRGKNKTTISVDIISLKTVLRRYIFKGKTEFQTKDVWMFSMLRGGELWENFEKLNFREPSFYRSLLFLVLCLPFCQLFSVTNVSLNLCVYFSRARGNILGTKEGWQVTNTPNC